MAELNKGSAIANKSWSSEKEIADADIEKELSNKEEGRKKDISDEISFYRQTKFSKTDAENITNKALGDSAFKRPDKHGVHKEVSMLSPEIQGIWKNIENKRVEGKSQTSHARSLLKKEGVAAQEKTKLESDLETLDERDAAFEDIGDIILREKNPRGILKAIQNLSNTYKIYQQEFQGQIEEQSDNIRALAGLQRLNTGINILSNFKNTISKIINNKEKNMTSKESSIIDPGLEINGNKKDQLEGGGIEQEESPQEVAKKFEAEIADVQNSTNAEVENNNANIKQKSGMIEDSVVRDQILADTQKSGSEIAQIVGSAVDAGGKEIKEVIEDQVNGKNKSGGKAVFNGPRISAEDYEKLNNIKNNGPEKELEPKNPEFAKIQERIEGEMKATEYELHVFENGKAEEVDALVNHLIREGKARGSKNNFEGTRKYLKNKLENEQKILYRIKALLKQSKSPEEFQSKINNELNIVDNNEKLKDTAKNDRKGVLKGFLPAEKKAEPQPRQSAGEINSELKKDSIPAQDKKEPVGKPQEPKAVEPIIADKSPEIQPDSQPKQSDREEIAAVYDQRIANLRLRIDEAKASGDKDEIARLEKFARKLEHEKKWRMGKADGKDQGRNIDKNPKAKVQNKDAQAPKDKTAEPNNYDQERQSLREQIKQAEKDGKGEEVAWLEREIYKLEQDKRNAEAAARDKDRENKRIAQERKYKQEWQGLREKIKQAEIKTKNSNNTKEVLRLEQEMHELEKNKPDAWSKKETEKTDESVTKVENKGTKLKTAFEAAMENDPFGHWKESQEPAKEGKKKEELASAEATAGKEKTEEEKLTKEAEEIKSELKNMPPSERRKIGIGLRNIGFFVQEKKSKALGWLCEQLSDFATKASGEELDDKGKAKSIQTAGAMTRFLTSLSETYKRDETIARQGIEQDPTSLKQGAWQQLRNTGYLSGNILKYGRTVADVAGYTAGSPLRYAMIGAQVFSRGAEAAKYARLQNAEVINKTRFDYDEAVEEAYKIYETAKQYGAEKKGKEGTEAIERAYLDQLPQDILNRLKKAEPGAATGIIERIGQKALQKYVELSLKAGKFTKIGFQKRLKEYDAMVSKYGTVDALAMSAKLAETTGKTAIAVVSVETAILAIKNLPAIVENLGNLGKGSGNSLRGIFTEWGGKSNSGGHIPPHEAGMPASGGSGKSAYEAFMDNKPKDYNAFPQDWPMKPIAQPEIPMGQGSFAERFLRAVGMHEGSPVKPDLQKIVAEYSEYFRSHSDLLKNNNSSLEYLNHLKSDLQSAGLDGRAADSIVKNFSTEMGKMGTGVYPESAPVSGIEASIGGGNTAEQAAAAAGAKSEAVRLVNEIENTGGIKHDSIWRSTHDLIREHAKEMGMEYPGKDGTKLTETEWYNLKTSQLVNELDQNTPDGIKDLVHEADKIIATKGSDGKFHIVLEESSGIKSGRLADLHHHAAEVKSPTVENVSTTQETASIQSEAPQPSPIAEDLSQKLEIDKDFFKESPTDDLDKDSGHSAIDQSPSDVSHQIKDQIQDSFESKNIAGMAGDRIREAADLQTKYEAYMNTPVDKIISGQGRIGTSMEDINRGFDVERNVARLIDKTGVKTKTDETLQDYLYRIDAFDASVSDRINHSAIDQSLSDISHQGRDKIQNLFESKNIAGMAGDRIRETAYLETTHKAYMNTPVDKITSGQGQIGTRIEDINRSFDIKRNVAHLIDKTGIKPNTGETLQEYLNRLDVGDGVKSTSAAEIVVGESPELAAPNNIEIDTGKLVADIEFKYNSSGAPVDMGIPSVKAGSHIDHLAYLDKNNLQSFDARTEGTRLSTYMEIYNKLKVDNMTGESGVVAEKIKKIVQNIEESKSGIVDYSKFPQELREKLGK